MTDGITLVIQGFHDMNNMRQQAMKKELNNDYAALCSSSTVDASSEFLSGDLSKFAKDITDAIKLSKKVHSMHHKATMAAATDILLVYIGKQLKSAIKVTTLATAKLNDILSRGHPPKSRLKSKAL